MGTKLLIAAGQSAAGPDVLPTSVRDLIGSAEEILVMAPALPGRFEWLSSATDSAQEQADERLRAVLGDLSEIASTASVSGTVGADDPILAFEDAIADFSPDHLVIGLRSTQRSGWQERGLIDELIARFELPVTVFQLPD
jgi:hypothetical protein